MAKKIKDINFERIAALVGIAAVLISFWQSQISMVRDQSAIKERLKEVEVILKINVKDEK